MKDFRIGDSVQAIGLPGLWTIHTLYHSECVLKNKYGEVAESFVHKLSYMPSVEDIQREGQKLKEAHFKKRKDENEILPDN